MRAQVALDDEGSFLVVEDEADRVMPSRNAVLSAARFDLHHAIQYCGGYRAVGRRCLAVPRHSFPFFGTFSYLPISGAFAQH